MSRKRFEPNMTMSISEFLNHVIDQLKNTPETIGFFNYNGVSLEVVHNSNVELIKDKYQQGINVKQYETLPGTDFFHHVKNIINDLYFIPDTIGMLTFNGVVLVIKSTSDVDDLWKIFQSGIRINYLEQKIENLKKILAD